MLLKLDFPVNSVLSLRIKYVSMNIFLILALGAASNSSKLKRIIVAQPKLRLEKKSESEKMKSNVIYY